MARVTNLASIVQNVDSAIFSIQCITQLVSLTLIHWIAIYPVDSVIQLLNNCGQANKSLYVLQLECIV